MWLCEIVRHLWTFQPMFYHVMLSLKCLRIFQLGQSSVILLRCNAMWMINLWRIYFEISYLLVQFILRSYVKFEIKVLALYYLCCTCQFFYLKFIYMLQVVAGGLLGLITAAIGHLVVRARNSRWGCLRWHHQHH